jgi:hypothetical protein
MTGALGAKAGSRDLAQVRHEHSEERGFRFPITHSPTS